MRTRTDAAQLADETFGLAPEPNYGRQPTCLWCRLNWERFRHGDKPMARFWICRSCGLVQVYVKGALGGGFARVADQSDVDELKPGRLANMGQAVREYTRGQA